MKPKIYLYGDKRPVRQLSGSTDGGGAEPVLSRDLFRLAARDGLLLPGGGDIGVTLEATDSFLIRSLCRQRPPHSGYLPGDAGTERLFFGGTPTPASPDTSRCREI